MIFSRSARKDNFGRCGRTNFDSLVTAAIAIVVARAARNPHKR